MKNKHHIAWAKDYMALDLFSGMGSVHAGFSQGPQIWFETVSCPYWVDHIDSEFAHKAVKWHFR